MMIALLVVVALALAALVFVVGALALAAVASNRRHAEAIECLARAADALRYQVQYLPEQPVKVVLPPLAEQTARRVASTCHDVQGFIELASRLLVYHFPDEAFGDLAPPEKWAREEVRG